jgi:arylsulfatase A
VRGRKNLPFEGGYRVPMIARWPGVLPAGQVCDELCSSMDLFSTYLSLAGISPPDDRIVDGRDILPVLQGQAPSPHQALYYYKGRRALGVRQGRWKYLRRHMTDNGGYASLRQGPFLFDLETDPNESYSMIESWPERARKMAQMLDEWDAAIQDNPRGWL